jgi:hypothetical protein
MSHQQLLQVSEITKTVGVSDEHTFHELKNYLLPHLPI